jgi:AraC-like DNA-binding protein
MRTMYDTTLVQPLERYEYARAGAGAELAPVALRGPAPGYLFAAMSVARVGDFAIEVVAWAADSPLVAWRTDRLIRACDPECYRIFLSVNGGVRMEQAGNQVHFTERDLAWYDLSRPWQATHTVGRAPMRIVMLTFPRALVSIPSSTLEPLIGTAIPTSLPGRSLVAQFLIELTDHAADPVDDSSLAEVLRQCTVGLIRQRLGLPNGLTPHTRRLLHLARIHQVIRRHLSNPTLGPDQIANAAHLSPRYLHNLFHDAQLTPMQLVKQLRLQQCHRDLQDPTLAGAAIKDIITRHGYRRPDQFTRDFTQHFGVSPKQARQRANQQPSDRGE